MITVELSLFYFLRFIALRSLSLSKNCSVQPDYLNPIIRIHIRSFVYFSDAFKLSATRSSDSFYQQRIAEWQIPSKDKGIPSGRFKLKSSYTLGVQSIRRSVENAITMDTRWNFDEKASSNICSRIYTLVKNVTELYEIDGITARPEKQDRFCKRASIIVFSSFSSTYIYTSVTLFR